jgi:hypothetical protein
MKGIIKINYKILLKNIIFFNLCLYIFLFLIHAILNQKKYNFNSK